MAVLPQAVTEDAFAEICRDEAVLRPDRTWRLCGLIDFEPAMRGEREYEFVSVGVFAAQGDARF